MPLARCRTAGPQGPAPRSATITPMARTWLSIRVDLVDGGGLTLWPRPGRVLAAARSHSFAHLATAIDDAFARWDRAHLHMFDLGKWGGLLIGQYWDNPPTTHASTTPLTSAR